MNYGVVILGAGASSRMGRPKLLLPWNGTTVVGHLSSQWNGLGATQVTIVVSDENQLLNAELDRLEFPVQNRLVNPHPEQGMFSSIQCAARWTGWEASLSHWVITLGDQPHLKRATLLSLIEFSTDQTHRICQPSVAGRPRHPVVLPRSEFEQLRNREYETLAHFLRDHQQQIELLEINDPGLNLDLDTPADYETALHLPGDWAPTASGERKSPPKADLT